MNTCWFVTKIRSRTFPVVSQSFSLLFLGTDLMFMFELLQLCSRKFFPELASTFFVEASGRDVLQTSLLACKPCFHGFFLSNFSQCVPRPAQFSFYSTYIAIAPFSVFQTWIFLGKKLQFFLNSLEWCMPPSVFQPHFYIMSHFC